MTARKGVTRPYSSRLNRANRLKDEICRQMYWLEESRPGAEMGLALALLRAWAATDPEPETGDERDWLQKISPICLQMIESSLQKLDSARRCMQ
jgi:hypothetical protein